MTTTPEPTDPVEDAPAPAPARALWAERAGPATYTGRNGRGAEVRIGRGDAEGVFSPGELLQLALAACSVLSADHALRSRLGDDFPAVVGVSATKVDGENRYGHLDAELVVDLAALAEEKQEKLRERVHAISERQCTVGRTLAAGATHELVITHEPMTEEG